MSKFMDFYKHVMSDDEVRKEFEALAGKMENDNITDPQAKLEQLVGFARGQGFDFETGEVEAYLAGMQECGELSDDELDAVAGGKGGCFIIGVTSEGKVCFVVSNSEMDGAESGACYIVGAFVD